MRRIVIAAAISGLLLVACAQAEAQTPIHMLRRAVGQAPAAGLPSQVVAWYNMDEASGDALDSIGSANFTDNNSVGSTTAGNCVVGTCRTFTEGSQTHFSSTAAVHDMDQEFAVCGWVYENSSGTQASQTFVGGNSASATEVYQVWISESAGIFQVEYFDSGGPPVGSINGDSYTDDTWAFVCTGFDPDGDVVWIEVNGATRDTVAETASALRTWSVTRLGTRNGVSQMLDGRMDEVVWMNDTPSTTFTNCLYNGGSGRSLSDAQTNCTTF